jgi:hypothetical protein
MGLLTILDSKQHYTILEQVVQLVKTLYVKIHRSVTMEAEAK